MYFWISICLDVQTQCLVFFHYVPRFFLKYKMFLLEICVLVLAKKNTSHVAPLTLKRAGGCMLGSTGGGETPE